MAKEVNLRFRNESGPDGKAWASLSAGTILRRYNPEKGLGTTQKSVRRMKKRGWKNGQIEKAFHLQKGTVYHTLACAFEWYNFVFEMCKFLLIHLQLTPHILKVIVIHPTF